MDPAQKIHSEWRGYHLRVNLFRKYLRLDSRMFWMMCILGLFFLKSGYSEFHSKLGAAFDISQIWFVRTWDRFSSKSPLYQSAFNSNLFWTIWVWRSWVGITADGAPLLRKSQFWAQCHYMFGCQGWSILLLNHRGATIGPLSMFFFVWRSMFSLFFCDFDHRM